MRPSPKDVN